MNSLIHSKLINLNKFKLLKNMRKKDMKNFLINNRNLMNRGISLNREEKNFNKSREERRLSIKKGKEGKDRDMVNHLQLEH